MAGKFSDWDSEFPHLNVTAMGWAYRATHGPWPVAIYCASPSDFKSFLVCPPEISRKYQQRHLVAKQATSSTLDTWEWPVWIPQRSHVSTRKLTYYLAALTIYRWGSAELCWYSAWVWGRGGGFFSVAHTGRVISSHPPRKSAPSPTTILQISSHTVCIYCQRCRAVDPHVSARYCSPILNKTGMHQQTLVTLLCITFYENPFSYFWIVAYVQTSKVILIGAP
jgi:hypothetical protein